MLKEQYVSQDNYIFYEQDTIDSIYFLSNGSAGFVLPNDERIVVYIELFSGEDFGQVDIISAAVDLQMSIDAVIMSE